MLKLDEYNQLLVHSPFSDYLPSLSSRTGLLDTSVSLTPDFSSQDHPLRDQSVSPVHRCNRQGVPSVAIGDNEGEMQYIGWGEPSSDVAADDTAVASEDQDQGNNDMIIHTLGPNDSFAGVALRYGVSIAALRRANQLWPSDPIHLRTELLVPRGNAFRTTSKATRSRGTDAPSRSSIEPTPDLFPLTSSFISVRDIILSLPARISLESLSSKGSTNQDHEMDDFRATRSHTGSAAYGIRFTEDGYELPVLASSQGRYKRPDVSLSSPPPFSPAHDRRLDIGYIPSAHNLRPQSICSSSSHPPAGLLRSRPFAALPVRTSQLEPEPAMELPVRRARI